MEEVRAIQAAREESVEKRKELVEQVKQLKAADDAGRLALLNTTMRAFQKEVERLSSRAMFAEAAFERLHEQASLNQGAQPATLQAAMTEKEELREKLETTEAELTKAQMSEAAQSMLIRSLQVSPCIQSAVAHLQMHQVGCSGGQRISLPAAPK